MQHMTRGTLLLFLAIKNQEYLMQKILLTALVAGLISGLFVFVIQSVRLTPLILEAEVYEEADTAKKEASETTSMASMGMEHHHHEEEAWEPANGFERNAYRLLADIGVGVGFALLLIGAFTLRGEKMDAKRGVLWGLAAFAVFSLAPGFGLPPELPATMAAALDSRQIWWVATATATAIGLSLIIFKPANGMKALGIVIMVLPHVIGAPKPPLGGVVPTELNAEFAAASLATMAMFWAVLGAASGWFYGRKSKLAV
jgi:cobalt transporter subunit CbtA